MANARMPEEFFDTVAHHLPPEQPVGPKGGRPRLVIRVIWFVLSTEARWEMGGRPAELGCSGRTAHRRLRAWEEAGIWDRLHADLPGRLKRATPRRTPPSGGVPEAPEADRMASPARPRVRREGPQIQGSSPEGGGSCGHGGLLYR